MAHDEPNGNGNSRSGEAKRWLLTMAIAAVVGYFSAQITTERRVTAIETAEQSHFAELQRALARIEFDIRDIRAEVRKQ